MVKKMPLPGMPTRHDDTVVGSASGLAEAARPPFFQPAAAVRESSRQKEGGAGLPQALRAALRLAHQPSLARKYRREPLPPDVLGLIRIAGRSNRDRDRTTDAIEPEATVSRAVAIFYLEQVLWTEPRDPFRVLGLRPGAAEEEVIENAHWLMEWLHPYIGANCRETEFADRVLEAWAALNAKPEEASGEEGLSVESPEATHHAEDGIRQERNHHETSGNIARRTEWRLSLGLTVVIAMLAIAGAALGAKYLSQRGGDIPATNAPASQRSTER